MDTETVNIFLIRRHTDTEIVYIFLIRRHGHGNGSGRKTQIY